MIPVARSENLLIQNVGNETIVYDQENNASHCLNSIAAKVWHYCDGQNSVKDIANLLEKDLDIPADKDMDIRGLVWLALEELERYRLIKKYLKQSTGVTSISRRQVVKTGVLVGSFAIGSMFPLVKSIVAPTPAMAVSTEENRSEFTVTCTCTNSQGNNSTDTVTCSTEPAGPACDCSDPDNPKASC